MATVPAGVEEFVERAGRPIEHERMPIAALLDRNVGAKWVWARIALGGVGKRQRHPRVRVVDDGVRIAVGCGSEIRMEVAGSHVREPLCTACIDGQRRDISVPDVGCRKHGASRELWPGGRWWWRRRRGCRGSRSGGGWLGARRP